MNKRIGIILTVVVIIILLYSIVKPIRTPCVISNIAQREFQNIPMYDSVRKQLKGPIILKKNKYSEFMWYRVLDWGDTAAIYIDVYKYPTSFSWRDDYFWPRITMNYQWGYLASGSMSTFKDVLPLKYENNTMILSSLQLFPNQENYYESSEVSISPEGLFYFLKKGYFEVLEKKEDFTVVAFYQPIGNVYVRTQNKIDTVNTMTAKVLINEAFEVLIIPYNAPPELWGKTHK
ncbi:MAG: hypothetical protein KJ578_03815 [Bacteroidetes bacterium]|nr:hypothetical protein [Bacteroidota bacterium]MBU1579141.1 hypothetical protein [Bacteroidota bacterium]MBU2556887.1 hypothetical protein [Bacteroidota bacterium]